MDKRDGQELQIREKDKSSDNPEVYKLDKVYHEEHDAENEEQDIGVWEDQQQLWAGVLNLEAESIGPNDSFFRLGGDSIAAMKLVAEAHKQGMHMTVASVHRNLVFHHLARVIQSSTTSAFQSPASFSLLSSDLRKTLLSRRNELQPSVLFDSVEDIQPVSYMQEKLLCLGIRNPRAAFTYFYVDLDLSIDAGHLENGCRQLVQHLPILRTHFAYFEGHLFQVVLRELNVPFTKFEIDGSFEEESDAVVLRDIQGLSPLGVPIAFIFLRQPSTASRLFIRLSHAQYDGVSLPFIFSKLATILDHRLLTPAPDFSAYSAYSRQRSPLSACYWSELLRGSHLTKFLPNLCSKTSLGKNPSRIDLTRSIPIPKLPADITIASLVSSAWALVLSQLSREEDVVYGCTVAGRNSDLPGIMDIVGLCANIIPVRTDVSATKTAVSLLRSTQEQYVSLGESDSMNFNDIARECTNWPAGSWFESIVQHRNVNENPEVHIAGGLSKVQYFDNPFAVINYLFIFSEVCENSLNITVAANTHILTIEYATKISDMLCETISKLPNNLLATLATCKLSLQS